MNLTELIEEFREIEIYEKNPEDWRNFLHSDDEWNPDEELAHWAW